MRHRLRLLCLASFDQARDELERLDLAAEASTDLLLALLGSAVKVYGICAKAASPLVDALTQAGGRALLSRSISNGRHSAGDAILLASLDQMRALEDFLPAQAAARSVAREIRTLVDGLQQPASYLAGRSCRIDLGSPRIMGILNVTPDSFSDGGRFFDPEAALAQARLMVAEGADLIDVGGESTRPGAPAVAEADELARVLPVIRLLSAELPVPLSIDTTKSGVASAAVTAGADFINDVSGLQFDPDMARVAADSGAGLFLMHTRGRSDQMQINTVYQDLVGEVSGFLAEAMDKALTAGVARDRIALDPGIGFGKSAAGNLEMLGRLGEFLSLGRPLLLGTSRKSFIGKILDRPDPGERLYGSVATVALGVAAGASIFRVHDVGPSREAALMARAIRPVPTFR